MNNIASYSRHNLELRAAEYYASIRKPENEWKTIADLAPQLAEFEHRVHAGDYDIAGEILEFVDYAYLYRWGHYVSLLKMNKQLLGQITDPNLRIYNLVTLGRTYYVTAQFELAIHISEQALTDARGSGNRQKEVEILGILGGAYHALGQCDKAIVFHQDALRIAREINDQRGESIQLSYLGWAYRVLGQVEKAIPLYEQALSIVRDIGDRQQESVILGHLGRSYHDLMHLRLAKESYEQALAIAREINARQEEGMELGHLGTIYREMGDFRQARASCEDALRIAREVQDRREDAVQLGRLGRIQHLLGQYEEAIGFYEQALISIRETGDRREESFQLGQLANTYRALSQGEKAKRLYEQALHIAVEIGDHRGGSYWRVGLSRMLLLENMFIDAMQYCRDALALGTATTTYSAELILGIATLYQDPQNAHDVFTRVSSRCRELKDREKDLYEPHYMMATALVGQAVCDPRWADVIQRTDLLAPALAEYRHALDITSAPGVVRDALRDLELIRVAGIEGMEPVFELLEGALNG